MFPARPKSDAAQSESMEISVLSRGLGAHPLGMGSFRLRDYSGNSTRLQTGPMKSASNLI